MAYFKAETAAQADLIRTAALLERPTRYVLRGRVVTMDATGQVWPNGCIGVLGSDVVHVGPVDQPLPAELAEALQIDTGGTIYPGLIELHNHPTYNFVPLWEVPERYTNRNVWRASALYKRRVSRPARLIAQNPDPTYPRSVVRYVECRALLGGTTTIQGISARDIIGDETLYQGLVRNVEFPRDAEWPRAEGAINDFGSVAQAEKTLGPILGNPMRPFILHLSEGTDVEARAAFFKLQRSDQSWLVDHNLVAIHATALAEDDFGILARSGGVIWSPLSNFLLYGATTDVAAAQRAGVGLALGSDWGPSGSKNLLGELKIARLVSAQLGGLFSDRDLVGMVTREPARMIGWDRFVGSIETGKRADLFIIGRTVGDAYADLIDASEDDVQAVIIDGRPRAGRPSLLDPRTPGVELFRVGGSDMVFDLVDGVKHPLAGTSLTAAVATLADGLARLPELADTTRTRTLMLDGAPGRWMLALEIDDAALDGESPMRLLAEMNRSDVDAMTLEPMAAVDDATYGARLRANRNLPDWVKDGLPS
ncbi:amidohydrolase family protein [Microvirga yunnanensis]|uniref:amidohydrolase family protein n=1 Tax=Microvirga yunnanensis TaxID=2953740 RepID=UPI0021C84F28|nr:amidohydrolase family protein [Microvirga sp. HBU65207]